FDQDVQVGLVAEAEGVGDREQGAVRGEGQAVAGAELVVGEVPDHAGRGATGGGQHGGVEGGGEDVDERVVAAFAQGPGVPPGHRLGQLVDAVLAVTGPPTPALGALGAAGTARGVGGER